MRIAIPTLPNPESKSLADLLEKAGHLVVSDFPSFTVELHPGLATVVDAPDAMFGRLAVFRIGELTSKPVGVQVSGGNLDDRKVVVFVRPEDIEPVCVGILRACDQVKQFGSPNHKVVKAAIDQTEIFANLYEAIKEEQDEFLKQQLSLNNQQNDLLNSKVESLRDSIHYAKGELQESVEKGIASVKLLTDSKLAQLADTVTTEGFRTRNVANAASQLLHDDLFTYFNRKRWWEIWK